jgi:hypothetical protein
LRSLWLARLNPKMALVPASPSWSTCLPLYFVYSLMTCLMTSVLQTSSTVRMNKWIMTWKGCGRSLIRCTVTALPYGEWVTPRNASVRITSLRAWIRPNDLNMPQVCYQIKYDSHNHDTCQSYWHFRSQIKQFWVAQNTVRQLCGHLSVKLTRVISCMFTGECLFTSHCNPPPLQQDRGHCLLAYLILRYPVHTTHKTRQ